MKRILAKILFGLSIPVIIVGYFLQTILIPLQDVDTLTIEDIKKIQLDVAINYPLGTTMLYVGFIIFLGTSIYLFHCYHKEGRLKRKRKVDHG